MEFAPPAVGAGELHMPPTPGSGEMGQAIMGAQQAALVMEISESLRTISSLIDVSAGSGEMGQAIMGAQQAALVMEISESLRTISSLIDVSAGSGEMGQAIMGAQQAESLRTTVKLLEQKVKDLEEEKYKNLRKVKLLEQKVKDLEEEKYKNLRNERDQLKNIRDKCAPKRLVIAFVELIEKADKYFELEDYLKLHSDTKPDSDPDYILNTIVQSPVRTERFKMLENEFIRDAIEERINRMKDAERESSLYKYRMFLTHQDLVMLNRKNAIVIPRKFPGLSSNEMENELRSYIAFISSSSSSREDRVAKYRDNAKKKFDSTLAREKFENPSGDMFYDVVFRSREGLYTMDHDPEVELQKMLKIGPVMCVLIPMLKKMMTLDHASTVIVCDVPPHASDDDIKESFSDYGDIISVKMSRMDEFQVAIVTYKDRRDAKLAVSVGKAKVCNQEVRVLPQRYYQAPAGSGLEPLYIPTVKPSKEESEERFRIMREKALEKYRDVIKRHAELQVTDGEKALEKYRDVIKRHAELQVTDGKAASGGTNSTRKNDVDESEIFQPLEVRDVSSASNAKHGKAARSDRSVLKNNVANAKHMEAGSSGGSVNEMSRSMASMGFVEKGNKKMGHEVEKKMTLEAEREARRKRMEMEALRSFFRPGQ